MQIEIIVVLSLSLGRLFQIDWLDHLIARFFAASLYYYLYKYGPQHFIYYSVLFDVLVYFLTQTGSKCIIFRFAIYHN